MKIKKKASTTYVSSEHEGVIQSVNVKNISMLTSFMRDKIYSDPRKAAITETISNAVDEHKKYNIEKPVDVVVTRDFITIRDYAKGLSEKEVYDVFFTYLNSTKDKTDDYIGGFGIGAKSPSSYSDTWYVESYYNGKLNVYVSSIEGDNGVTRKLFSDVDKPGESGICVKIPVTSKQNTKIEYELKAIILLLRDIVLFASSESEDVINVYYCPDSTLDAFESKTAEEKEAYRVSKNLPKIFNYRKEHDSIGILASKYTFNNEFAIDEWVIDDKVTKYSNTEEFRVTAERGIICRYRKDGIRSNDIIVSYVDNGRSLKNVAYAEQSPVILYPDNNINRDSIIVTDGYSYYPVSASKVAHAAYIGNEDNNASCGSVNIMREIEQYIRYFTPADTDRYYSSYLYLSAVVFFDRSEMPIMPNRESLRDDNIFYRALYDKLCSFKEYMRQHINDIAYILLTSNNERHNELSKTKHVLSSNISYFENIRQVKDIIDKSDTRFKDILPLLRYSLKASDICAYVQLNKIGDKVWFVDGDNTYFTDEFLLSNANLIYLHVANHTDKFKEGNTLVPGAPAINFNVINFDKDGDKKINLLSDYTKKFIIIPEDIDPYKLNYAHIEYGICELAYGKSDEKDISVVSKNEILKSSEKAAWYKLQNLCVIQGKEDEIINIIKEIDSSYIKNINYFLLSDIQSKMESILSNSIHYDASLGFGFYKDSVVHVDYKNRILINRSRSVGETGNIKATKFLATPLDKNRSYTTQKIEIDVRGDNISKDTLIGIYAYTPSRHGKKSLNRIASIAARDIIIVPEIDSKLYNKFSDKEKERVNKWIAYSKLPDISLAVGDSMYTVIVNNTNYTRLKQLGFSEGRSLDVVDEFVKHILVDDIQLANPFTYMTMLLTAKRITFSEDNMDKMFTLESKSEFVFKILACLLYSFIVPEPFPSLYETSPLSSKMDAVVTRIKAICDEDEQEKVKTKILNILIKPYKDNLIKCYKLVKNKKNYNKLWRAIKLMSVTNNARVLRIISMIRDRLTCDNTHKNIGTIMHTLYVNTRIGDSEVTYMTLMKEYNKALGFDEHKNIGIVDKDNIINSLKKELEIE